MPASRKTPEPRPTPPEHWLIGRVSEHRELTLRLSERPRLMTIESDPLSGTSALLAIALGEVDRPALSVDARAAADALDLAMAITEEAIRTLHPEASAWWNGPAAMDIAGLRLARRVGTAGIDLDELRDGSGRELDRLRDALEAVAVMADGPVVLAIDHLDALLNRLSAADATELLATLRAGLQRKRGPQVVLAGYRDGRLARAVRDKEQALYRAGEILELTRPHPQRFADDTAAGLRLPVSRLIVAALAELAAGVPAYVWRAAELVEGPGARGSVAAAREAALAAWHRLADLLEPDIARQFDLLGSLHRAAPTIVAAVAVGLGPYEVDLNDKTIRDALHRMRDHGIVFSPRRSRWVLADPLLARWARANAPTWTRRRAAMSL